MANSSTVIGGVGTTAGDIPTIVQDNIGETVTSVLFPRFVLLYLLMRKDGTKQGVFGLGAPMVNGKPNTGIYVAGKQVMGPRKEQIMGALEFKPLIQYQELQDYTTNIVNLHDVDPQVENWESNQIESTLVRPSWHWSVKSTPIEVSQMNMRMTKAAAGGTERAAWRAIGDIWLSHTNMALPQHCRGINSEMCGSAVPSTSTDAPASVTSPLWSKQYSIPSILGTSNNYAGVDRSLAANTYFRGNRNTTSQSINIRDMLTYARYTAPVYSGASQIGTGLSTFGLFVDVLIMGNDLFPSALAQMQSLSGQVIHSGGFPDYPEVGYNRQVAVVDGSVAIINEPGWPAGTVAGLSLDTWFVAIHPDANFTATPPEKQNRVAGGHRSFAATIETQWMFGTTAPQANVLWTAVTA